MELKFVSILKESNEALSDSYASSFHSSFSSPKLGPSQRDSLMETFNIQEFVSFKPDLKHSNYLFLLTKSTRGKWRLTKAFPDIDSYLTFLNRQGNHD